MKFLILILSLPTENSTLRMRAWRALKAIGAAALRDGVYLLPETVDCRTTLEGIVGEVRGADGTAWLLRISDEDDDLPPLFDRREDYRGLIADASELLVALKADTATDALKVARKLRKTFTGIEAIDYFPGEAKRQAESIVLELERRVAQALSPDEPHFIDTQIARLNTADYQGRIWATRRRPWVDRLASAWLIRRFIDHEGVILWLPSPGEAPDGALGFDYDGAAFTHVGGQVTFEVIAASFGLDSEPLRRIAGVVHFLDVGGLQPPEAVGLESVLKGMRDGITDDDALLVAACLVFDGLYAAFGGAND